MRLDLLLGAAILSSLGSSLTAQAQAQAPAPEAAPAAADRARANYEAIQRGEKTLFQLTPSEQDEVRALDGRIRSLQPPDHGDPYERCIDAEYARLGRDPTALDERTIEARCR